MAPRFNDAGKFRALALEALAIADQMKDPDNQTAMMAIAAVYKRLAEQAEKESARWKKPRDD
jgi:hypothetical protein